VKRSQIENRDPVAILNEAEKALNGFLGRSKAFAFNEQEMLNATNAFITLFAQKMTHMIALTMFVSGVPKEEILTLTFSTCRDFLDGYLESLPSVNGEVIN
jgi:hypothetical protein